MKISADGHNPSNHAAAVTFSASVIDGSQKQENSIPIAGFEGKKRRIRNGKMLTIITTPR